MLTDTKIKQLKPQEKTYRVADHSGLSLEVRTTGAKFWRYRYRHAGKASMVSLGEYPVVSLAQARQKALEQAVLLSQSINPSQHKQEIKDKQNRKSLFRDIAMDWYNDKSSTRSSSFRDGVLKSFEKDIFPAIGNKDISLITPYDILSLQKTTIKRVAKQSNRGTGENTAIRNRQIVNAVFKYAIANLHCDHNPAISLGQTVEKPAKQTAQPLSLDDRSRFIPGIAQSTSTKTVKNAVRFLAYSMLRSIEVCRLQWVWVDYAKGVITIPAATKAQMDRGERNIKMNRTHMIPITKQIMVILNEQENESPFIFPAPNNPNKPMNKTTINKVLASIGLSCTAHDFRATASTLLHEHGYSSEWIELQLAHVDKNIVRGTYNHAQNLEGRKEMMQFWNDLIDQW